MATFEQVGLVFQILGNVYGLVNNMRDNANGYIAQESTQTPDQISTVMRADANQYLKRIGWITTIASNNLTLFTNALTALGLTVSEANSLKTTLQNVANHTLAATLATNSDITTEANFILASVPNMARLW